MATAVNKQRVLTHVYTILKNRYGLSTPEERPVLTQFVYAICREGATREQADPNPFVAQFAPSLGQIGLKLETGKGSVEFFVIERAEKPLAN